LKRVYPYWAYGLRIDAELPCSGLPVRVEDGGAPDVTVHLLPPADEALEKGHYEVRPDVFYLEIPQAARFRVEEGRRIFVEPVADADAGKIQIFLKGSVLGALLYQRGLFPLHGSAVETPWGGMIFVGPQGMGKSTLAAEFHRRGYRLLSDDVCALRPTETGIEILPGFAQFRLCADAFERLNEPAGGRFEVDKFVVPMGEGFCPEPVPLRAVHILANRAEDSAEMGPSFAVLQGFARVSRLVENVYRPGFLKGQATQNELMRLAGVVAQKSTLAVVERRRNAEEIGETVEFLEARWAERFAPSGVKESACAV
jgi:hypothetical protein